MRQAKSFLLQFAILLLVAIPAAPSPSRGAGEADLLILHSYHMGQEWTDGVMAGMMEVLASRPDLRIHVEYMDTKRFHDPKYLEIVLATVLTHKLQKFTFDLVLLSDNDAFNFALAHRDDLFEETPIVFCGVNYFEPRMIEGVPAITGVAEIADYRGTLELALRLHPERRRVVVIANSGNETDRRNHQLLLEALPDPRPGSKSGTPCRWPSWKSAWANSAPTPWF